MHANGCAEEGEKETGVVHQNHLPSRGVKGAAAKEK
jgi:hypothetical protein